MVIPTDGSEPYVIFEDYNYHNLNSKDEKKDIKINNKLIHQSKLLKYFINETSSDKIEKDTNDLLKKVKKQGKACQLIKVSSGPKSLEKSLKLARSMIKTVEKGLHLKNRNSCMFCEFKDTIHCK